MQQKVDLPTRHFRTFWSFFIFYISPPYARRLEKAAPPDKSPDLTKSHLLKLKIPGQSLQGSACPEAGVYSAFPYQSTAHPCPAQLLGMPQLRPTARGS